MAQARSLLVFLALLLITGRALSQYAPTLQFQALPAQAQAILDRSGLPRSAFGIAVLPLPDGDYGPSLLGFGTNAREAFNPASVIKLVTTRSALGLLGPDFRHQTRIASTAEVRAGVLAGQVFFQGGGDPKLLVEDLREMALALRAKGIHRMEGQLIVDGSRFAEPEIDPGLFDQRPYAPYNVGPHAAMVNFKAMRVSVWPESGRGINIDTEPRLPAAAVQNRVRLVNGGCGRNQLTARMQNPSELNVTGVLGRSCRGADFYVSVLDHAAFVGLAFQAAWEEAGGSMSLDVASGRTPASARTLLLWESPRPLIELVSDMNKLSNNPMTRQLFLNLSARTGQPGTRAASATAVQAYLASRNLQFQEMVLENGSGLSRDERISPQSMVRLLTDALFSHDADLWLESLPLLGFEGTVRNRLRRSPLEGQAWLKTGSLEGVRSYAGYLRSAKDRWVVITAIVNHPEAGKAREALDELLKWAHESF